MAYVRIQVDGHVESIVKDFAQQVDGHADQICRNIIMTSMHIRSIPFHFLLSPRNKY